ncbi:MAG: glycosyltransferase [Leptolyngbyaceae cyanobacterium SM2_5_2]|nr:glycosyltransferase [Leptolyngbyaceae cyanobacterium SM2_5_2]
MNVLHINQSDLSGGAGIAGYRLHTQLRKSHINSRLLVDSAKLEESDTFIIQRRRFFEDFIGRISIRMGLNYLHISGSGNIVSQDFYKKSDILNLHNLHGGYFNYLAIHKLTEDKPAVFTLHDMWSFTGHCAYSFECDRWKTGCGKCPHLDTYPEIAYDNTAIEWKLKRWVYRRSSLVIVTPSQWLANLAHQSILNIFPIHHIPNGLDLNVYKPLDSELGRAALGIPPNKRVLLFIAQNFNDPRKGADLLLSALQKLPDFLTSNLILVTMGHGGEQWASTVSIPTLPLGYVGGDHLKALIYSTADIFVFPTRADNLPVVIQESMACGTPIVSFNVGGVPEMVRPGITGLLASPEDPDDLVAKITQILEDDSLLQLMKQNCRKIALAEYSIKLQAKRYIQLYQQVLNAGEDGL